LTVFIFISNGRPLPSTTHSPNRTCVPHRSSHRYTKTHGPEPIDLVNSITVIIIIIVVVVVVVGWCSVVMRGKYSFNFSFNPRAVVVSLLNAYIYRYAICIYIQQFMSQNTVNSLLIMVNLYSNRIFFLKLVNVCTLF